MTVKKNRHKYMKFHKTVSYLFHPIIFPIIGTILYFIFLPKHISSRTERSLILTVFITTYLLPMLFVYLLKRMEMIESYEMETIEERKFPLLFLTILSYLLGIMLYRTHIVEELAVFYFGMTLTLLISYFLLYVRFKISLHAIGIGGLIGFLGVLSFIYELNLIVILALFFIIAGAIMTSRLKLKAHESKEVYFGFAMGLLAQVIVYAIYNSSNIFRSLNF